MKLNQSMSRIEQLVTAVSKTNKYRHITPELIVRIGESELQKRRSLKEAIKATKQSLPRHEAEIIEKRPGNSSILMAYDFHYEPETDLLSLIEINTNASAFLFADIANRHNGNSHWTDAREKLLESFKEEGLKKKLFIIDEDLKNQKMFPEFLLYQEWLCNMGYEPTITNAENTDIIDGESFVYNRFNDFVFAEERSEHLRKAYLEGSQVFSPSPHEFILSADKLRLFEFAKHNVSDVLVPMKAFTDFESADALWAERKKYFFKPKRLYEIWDESPERDTLLLEYPQ